MILFNNETRSLVTTNKGVLYTVFKKYALIINKTIISCRLIRILINIIIVKWALCIYIHSCEAADCLYNADVYSEALHEALQLVESNHISQSYGPIQHTIYSTAWWSWQPSMFIQHIIGRLLKWHQMDLWSHIQIPLEIELTTYDAKLHGIFKVQYPYV